MADELPHNIFRSFSFEVYINGAEIGFKSVSGLKRALSFEPLPVGGMNNGVFMLPIPIKERGKITLERGKYFKSPEKFPFPGTIISEMSVSVYNDDDSFRVTYTLVAPIVEELELGNLDALSSEVLIEKLIVSYSSMEEKLVRETHK